MVERHDVRLVTTQERQITLNNIAKSVGVELHTVPTSWISGLAKQTVVVSIPIGDYPKFLDAVFKARKQKSTK